MPPADKLDKVTLLPRAGGVGGFARTMPDEDILDYGLISKAYLRARLVVALGGRAAELVVFGPSEVTQGASSDLQLVRRICRDMVMRYGFSSLGHFALEEEGEEVFLGRYWIRSSPHTSVRTGNRIDEQVRQLANEALERAVAVLTPRRELLDELVNRLIELETIDGDSFRSMVEAYETSGGSALPAQAGGKADIEAAQVGV